MTIRVAKPARDYDSPEDHAAGFEGRLRSKLESGEPLDLEEGLYLSKLPGARDEPYR